MTERQARSLEDVLDGRDLLAYEYEFLIHFTPSAEQRRAFAKSGEAMPDGSFYIRSGPMGRGDLGRAIQAVGRATPNSGESDTARRNAVRRHIIKRARALNLTNMIPDTWNSDGTLKQSATLLDGIDEFLSHYGVRGMHWGVRRGDNARGGGSSGGSNHPSFTTTRPRMSTDAETARFLQGRVNRGGTNTLSNRELQLLVTRLNLERQYKNLNPSHVSAGRKIVGEMSRDFAKQSAQQVIRQYGPKGAKWLAKRAGVALTGLAVRGALAAL